MRSAYQAHAEDTDFVQPGNFYRHTLSQTDRDHLVSNIVGHMGQNVERFVQERSINLWRQVDQDLGEKIARGLGLAQTSATPAE